MTPLPKRKHSSRREGKRKAAKQKAMPELVKCKNCGQPKMPHQLCKNCGK